MNTRFHLQSALAIAALLAWPLAQAATSMSKGDYQSGKARLVSEYKADKTACGSMAGNARDICVEQAKGKENVGLAELEYSYTGKSKDQNKIWVAQAEAAYAVAKEKCDDLNGNPKDVCVKEAKAARTKALADAKVGRVVNEAKRDAAQDKRDADYAVAAQKCDALAGDAKSACVTEAKARFGKT